MVDLSELGGLADMLGQHQGSALAASDFNELFSPDCLLPSQVMRYAKRDTGERRLLCAILEDAVETIRKAAKVKVMRGDGFHEADQWLHSDDWRWVFSAQNVCGHLGIDINALREELRPIVEAVRERLHTEPLLRDGRWAKIVRETLDGYGWSQVTLAAKIGCDVTTLCNWGRGLFDPAARYQPTLLRLHGALLSRGWYERNKERKREYQRAYHAAKRGESVGA